MDLPQAEPAPWQMVYAMGLLGLFYVAGPLIWAFLKANDIPFPAIE